MIVVGLASVAGSWLSATAYAGQVSFTPVTIDEVIARSEVIVYGTVADPPTGVVDRPTADGCPPYTVTRYNITVDRVLRNTPDGPAPRDRLTALAGNSAIMTDLAVRYCVEGVSKSPILDAYSAKVEWVPGAPVLLFLRWVDGAGWELVADGAIESGKKLKKVEKLLAPPAGA